MIIDKKLSNLRIKMSTPMECENNQILLFYKSMKWLVKMDTSCQVFRMVLWDKKANWKIKIRITHTDLL